MESYSKGGKKAHYSETYDSVCRESPPALCSPLRGGGCLSVARRSCLDDQMSRAADATLQRVNDWFKCGHRDCVVNKVNRVVPGDLRP